MTTKIKTKPYAMPSFIALAVFMLIILTSCNKWEIFKDHRPKKSPPTDYSSLIIEKWMGLQLRLMKNATGIPNHGFSRHYAYSGIACWEAIAPGVQGYGWVSSKWNGLGTLPQIDGRRTFYYWPANANAALAMINRLLFPGAAAADKAAIDSLEAAVRETYPVTLDQATVAASENFGKAIAQAVFNWAETDGYKTASALYVVPAGPGLWKPTPSAFAAPVTPYWGNNRTVCKGSTMNASQPAPLAYSTATNSPFYAMVRKVYQVGREMTGEQEIWATYWRDIPGVSSPGHWLSILQQTVRASEVSLAKAALAYALTGAAGNDALIACFKDKYTYNLVRPVTYIQEVMKEVWSPFLVTPAHPEYPSAHSALSAGTAVVFESLFGNPGSFTDHTYDYMGLPARTYSTYWAIAKDAGMSRLYGGIHYVPSIDAGLLQGKEVAANILGD